MMKHKTRVTISVLLVALLLGNLLFPCTTKAELNSNEGTTVLKTYSGSLNGVKRELVVVTTEDGSISEYIRVGDLESGLLWYNNIDVGIDKYGSIWIIDKDHTILWWSYDLEGNWDVEFFNTVGFFPLLNPDATDVKDAESLVFEGAGSQAIVTGYKSFSGEIRPLISFDEMKEGYENEESILEPHYIPDGMTVPNTPTPNTPTPNTPTPTSEVLVTETPVPNTPTPTQEVLATETPVPNTPTSTPEITATETPVPDAQVPIVEPTITPEPKATALSIERSKSKSIMYQGDTMVSKLTLKKGTLTWKRQGKNTKRYTGVKDSALILKSKNAVYITKKGVAYTVSYKTGKRKKIVKKGAKKIICSKGAAVKIKMTSGKTKSIKNK